MINKLTNLVIETALKKESIDIQKSKIEFEFSLDVPVYEINKNDKSIKIIFKEIPLNMPEGKYKVLDGIISYIEIKSENKDIISDISLDFNTDFDVKIIKNIPSKLVFLIDRNPLTDLFKDKKIIINPGFSNKTKSPTGLLQQVPMLYISKKLNYFITGCHGKSCLTWEQPMQKTDTSSINADIYIDIFTETSNNKSGFKVYYSNKNKNSYILANQINQEIEKKIPLDNLGIYEKSSDIKPEIIYVGIIPGMENQRLDDAHLRDLDYRNKISQGIFNGLVKFFTIH
ncbi:MAG: N-acetylmuramoyl-L-alanine amidase [Thermoanaerobacteraceae bacterium]